MGALEPHPALKAISPQASPADMWLGDDFHHNGAFRLSYGFEYAAMMESGKDVQQFSFDTFDTYDWYLSLGPLANVNKKYLHEKIPTWNDYVAHPDYDGFWKRQTMIPYLREVKVPTLSVAGWWDQEDFYGPIQIYEALEAARSASGSIYLVVGPWNHGGWSGGAGDKLGPIGFGSRDRGIFPRSHSGALVRVLPEGQGHARSAGGADVRGRIEPLAALGRVAAACAARRRDRSTSVRTGRSRSTSRQPRCRPSIATSPILPTRSRTAIARSSRRISLADRSGRRGLSRISDSSTIAPDVLSWETAALTSDVIDRRRGRRCICSRRRRARMRTGS